MSGTPPPRAVVDTSVWVRVFLEKHVKPPPAQPFRDIIDAFLANEFIPVYSEFCFNELLYMLTESVSVAKKHAIDPVKGGEFVGVIFAKAGEEVTITEQMTFCSDPDDDPIIETAYVGRVDYLVADDRAFHEPNVKSVLKSVGIRVLWSSEFRKELQRRRAPST